MVDRIKRSFRIVVVSLLICCSSCSGGSGSQVYYNYSEVINSRGNTIYMTIKKWGLVGNHSAICFSNNKTSNDDCFEENMSYPGVDILFFKTNGDTLTLRVPHKMDIDTASFPDWIFVQRAYNYSEFEQLIANPEGLGYGILE